MITPNNIAPSVDKAAPIPQMGKKIKKKTQGVKTGVNEGMYIDFIAALVNKSTNLP
jgi:hypothetical protein